MTIKLYCFGESGNSYKAALALELAGLDWEPVYVDFFRGEARTEAYLRDVNEMGEVPVMVDGDLKLTQSAVIQDYVSEKSGLFAGSDPREVMRWVIWDNHKMSSQNGIRRFLMNFLAEEKRPQQVIDWLGGRLKAAYTVLDQHLEKRDWIADDKITNADLSCCGYLFYPEPFGFDRTEWPNIDRWLGNIQSLPGWKHPYDLMPRAFPGAGA